VGRVRNKGGHGRGKPVAWGKVKSNRSLFLLGRGTWDSSVGRLVRTETKKRTRRALRRNSQFLDEAFEQKKQGGTGDTKYLRYLKEMGGGGTGEAHLLRERDQPTRGSELHYVL